ncbi:phage antirepressor N-terminal domain-containing protein [Pseudovibrio denitrificans]|uniref:phage antirepressor N-terminal domain-containing protein n=1 Tax=Pseudovibrio denitrificans TaxID=258256 RepID=UPI0039BFD843
MMNGQITQVEFRGDILWGFEEGKSVFIALKPIVEAIGIDWSSQLKRIKRDPILSEGMVIMTTPFGRGGTQDAACLRLDLVNGWLFTIDSSRIKDEMVRARVLDYQRECYGVLSQHFMGLQQTDAYADYDYIDLGATSEIGSKSRLVEIAAKISGPRAACELWCKLDLPMVPSFAPRPTNKARGVVAEVEDHLRTFIGEGCRLDPDHTMTARDMFLAYKDWATAQQHPAITETAFGRTMLHLSEDYNFLKVKGRVVVYRGLRVKEVGDGLS